MKAYYEIIFGKKYASISYWIKSCDLDTSLCISLSNIVILSPVLNYMGLLIIEIFDIKRAILYGSICSDNKPALFPHLLLYKNPSSFSLFSING